jgi:hypothetical protein
MKKIATLLAYLLIIMGLHSNAQSTRMVLIEEATNASCGPCASQNPAFDALLNANRDKLTAIKYHWYFPGYDPMHNHNPEENNARVSYYGINGVPTAAIDGDIPNGPTFNYPGGPHGYTQALIDEYAAVPSPLELHLSHHLSTEEDFIFIDMMIVATEDVAAGRRAHMVVVEKEVHFASPPGGNGEKDFFDVMKKMIPNEGGTILPALDSGEYIIMQGSWELANIYDLEQLGVVGFVQNNALKDVLQAGNSSADPLTPLYSMDCDVIGVKNISQTNCLGEIEPVVNIRNNGSTELTSLEISFDINGEEIFNHSWSGNLGFLEAENITLPKVNFELADTNYLTINVTAVNGGDDDYTINNLLVHSFERAEITPTTVKLLLKTDENPEENTWEIINSLGDVAASGGPYANPNTIYQETIELDDLECYQFFIYDSGGDGLLMPGFYAFYHGSNSYIITGTEFGSVDSAYFEVNTTVGIPDATHKASDIQVYPNPARDQVFLSFTQEVASDVLIQVFDLTGSRVITYPIAQVTPGEKTVEISTSTLRPGMYLLNINTGIGSFTKRLTIFR